MPSPRQIVLKDRYYLDHFHEMLDFVRERYAHAFEPAHERFITQFLDLSVAGQCLYVRLANRKGRIFPHLGLRYDEIPDLAGTIRELEGRGFTRPPNEADFRELLALRKRTELVDLLRVQLGETEWKAAKLTSARKQALVEAGARHLSFDRLLADQEIVVQERCDELGYVLFLYFGKLSEGMTSFALRDLGLMKTRRFQNDFAARFETREVAVSSYFFAQEIDRIDRRTVDELHDCAAGVVDWPNLDDPEVETLRHRAIHRLGRQLERAKAGDLALQVYRHSDQFPATERSVRLLMQQTEDAPRAEAEMRLRSMIEEPSCDEELIFAEDFYRRKFQKEKVGRLTRILREARIFRCDETGRGHPEASAIQVLAREGITAHHTENAVWTQLFGLLFWDLCYGTEARALHSAFEWIPQDLRNGTFYANQTDAIEARLRWLDEPESAVAALEQTFSENTGEPNALVGWWSDLLQRVSELVRLSPRGALAPILRTMAQDFRRARSGFPDLMVLDGDVLGFAEVKAEGDQIQRHQLTQIERLGRAGFPVEVIRVEWAIDPLQEYVVVDVETTGGKAEWHKLTEIGAVRVIGNEVVAEWSTLLNPGRRIPKNIVELTGITDEMVRDAPTFDQVADEFCAFVGEAVFVAHRASFDYGFIREEYRRLEQDFRRPTLCTVVTTRKFFPGLKSYGLKNLCQEFEIDLDSHHRALCDAKATAQILLRINQRRLEQANR